MMSRNVVESQLPSVGIPFVLINQMPSLMPLWFDWMLACCNAESSLSAFDDSKVQGGF
jgi:hypothetical protein